MVLKVQCDKCLTRYKLDESRIKGKGARITCPKCGNQFVVYRNQEPEPAHDDEPATIVADRDSLFPPGIATSDLAQTQKSFHRGDPFAGPAPSQRRPPTPDPFDDEFGDDEATIVAPAMGMNYPTQAIQRPNPFSPPTPRPPVADIPRPPVPDGAETEAAGDRPIQEPPVNREPPPVPRPASAENLDWRAVGLTAFKVKVSFGMVYDFSDVSTLKKYLSDKKVAITDKLSMDGQSWHEIGKLGDLDTYFIDRWVELKAAQGDVEPPEANPPPTPRSFEPATASGADPFSTEGTKDASPFTESKKNALGAALFDEVESGGSETVQLAPTKPSGATSKRGNAKKAPKSPVKREVPKTKAPSSGPQLILPILLVLVAGGLGWALSSGTLAAEFEAVDPIDKKGYQAQLHRQAEGYFPIALNAQGDGQPAAEAPAPAVEEKAEESEAANPDGEAAAGEKDEAKAEAPAKAKPKRATRSKKGTSVQVSSISADLLIELGDSRLKSKDYAAAIDSYQKATKMKPKNGSYHVKLGRALQLSGAYTSALSAYKKGLQLTRSRADAHKWSGECYEKLGQNNAAVKAYQTYLDTAKSASDRAEIEARIAKLS